jgi:hypothetical protein
MMLMEAEMTPEERRISRLPEAEQKIEMDKIWAAEAEIFKQNSRTIKLCDNCKYGGHAHDFCTGCMCMEGSCDPYYENHMFDEEKRSREEYKEKHGHYPIDIDPEIEEAERKAGWDPNP